MQEELKKFSVAQLFNFCIGFFGLQFAWQMRIILSGPVTESLGASPLIFGLIWLAGPISGIIVQPIIGALSDTTQTKFGRRVPYLLLGALSILNPTDSVLQYRDHPLHHHRHG